MQRRRSIPNGNTKNWPPSSFCRRRKTWSFHVVLQRTAKKGTKIYNARAQPLFCSLKLLFNDVLVELFFFVKKYLLVGASGMLWAGESVSGSVDHGSVRDVCMSHQSDWIYY